MSALLTTTSLTVSVTGRTLVEDLGLTLAPGNRVAVLGPNGVGKTLTLHTLCGLRTPAAGGVALRGEDLRLLEPRERARRVGLLLQEQEDPFPTTVLETALMGRHAQLGVWQWETAEDEAVARKALDEMDLAGMADREAGTLSGGERRRLGLASLLVQDPDVLLLDEPLNHLDPSHQFAVLAVLERLAAEGKAIVASLHDPVLAARHFASALLLHGDGRWQYGPVTELLTAPTLSALYGVAFETYRSDDPTAAPIMLPTPHAVSGAVDPKVTPLHRRRGR